MHSSPTTLPPPPPHARPSPSSHSPLARPSPPPHPSPGHHPRSHHVHHASIAHLPTIAASASAAGPSNNATLHPHHHAHALSLSTLPSYLSPTFNPSHPKPSPSHKPPHPPLDSAQKDYYTTTATTTSQHSTQPLRPWRLTSRVRTTAVALCLCLNAGIDPPDAERSQSSHQLSYTPILASPSTATATVMQRLQAQYERWQPKATYRHIGDPTPSQLEKQLRSLRRSLNPTNPNNSNGGNERLLLHYCGYGVPRVTGGGEVWLFNREYTQYLPVGIREVLGWCGWPAVVVAEAAGAGALVEEVGRWVAEGKRMEDERREAEGKYKSGSIGADAAGGGGAGKEKEEERKEKEPGEDAATPRAALSILSSISSAPSPPPTSASPPPPTPAPLYPSATDLIVLSATSAGQSPPLHPSLPADLFTCCLTTPITIALRHFSLHSPLLPPLTTQQLDGIPGTLTDRRTPLGELNWIFTSITDTIAFSSLPPQLFHQLYRQDLLVSSLFRNFLLAQRLLRQYGVVVSSWPAVPSCHKHSLWEAWDSVVESYCLQLDRYLHHKVKFTPSPFFSDQLAAFELTLDLLSASSTPPLQLPIVLQLLLSPSHRRRALLLLARFLSRSTAAVQQVLDVGIFPYVLKLLEGGGGEVREVLCYVWVKLIASDSSVADELLSGGGWRYFLEGIMAAGTAVSERQRSMCLYVLAQLLAHKVEAQAVVSSPQLCTALCGYFDSDNAALRKWSLLLLAKLLHGQPIPPLSASASSPSATQLSPAPTLPDRVTMLCFDTQPDVRAAAVYTLSCLLDDPSNSSVGLPISSSFSSSTTSASLTPSLSPPPSPLDDGTDGNGSGGSSSGMVHSMHMLTIFRLLCSQLAFDGSGSVREELVVALSVLVDGQLDEFREAAREDEKERDDRSDRRREASEQHNPLPPLPPLTPTATQRSPSPLVSPVHGPRKLHGLQQSSLAAVGRGSSGSPHSSSPSPSPPPTMFTSFGGSSLNLPLSRAFSEPPQSITAVRPAPPPSLILSPSGSSSASLSSLPDNSRPPSPATTALSTLTASSSSSSLFLHDRAYLTPPRSLRLPLSFSSSSSSPLQQRQHVWRCIRLLCQDALPAVATAAVNIYRRVKEGNTNKGSKHKPSPVLNPHTQPDGLLVLYSNAGNEPSPRSLTQIADSPLKPEADGEAVSGGGEKRSHAITLNPLRRIASAASNMAHAASEKTHSLFSSASSASLHDGDKHPTSSSQSSPVHSASSSPQTVPAFAPSSSHLSMLSLLSTPVTSSIFTRSSESFLVPSIDLSSVASSSGAVVVDSATSTLLSLLRREYRHRQNEQMYRAESALAFSSFATASPFDLLYTLPSPASSSSSSPTASSDVLTSLLFHPYQPLLFATTSGRVSVFDLYRRERRCIWSNDNRASTRITGAALVNPHSVSLLATATDSGEVRVWRWPHERQPLLVNAWQGLRVGVAGGGSGGMGGRGRSAGNGGGGGSGGVGMVMEWMQSQGWMCCGGASEAISVWDVEREACIIDLPIEDLTGGMAAGANSGLPYFASVTCLTSSTSSPLLFSGGLDGTLRCFDLRVPSASSCVTLSKQQSPLLRVQCTKAHDVIEEGNVVCASRDGEVLRVDMRYIVQRDDRDRANSLHPPGSSVGPVAHAGTVAVGGMTALTLSPAHIPLTAASSRNGSPSPSAASTAGSMSSLSSLHPSPMLFPSHGSPISTASSPAMLPSSSHNNSPTLLSSASPFTHLTAFPSTSPATPASPLSAFAVHPALSLYAAVSTGRSLRVFSDHSTLLNSGAKSSSRPTQSSPQRRATSRGGKEGRAGGGGGSGAGDGNGSSESVVAWHPCVLTMAACVAGGDIAVYGQAASSAGGGPASAGGAASSGGGKGWDSTGSGGNINRSSHGLFSSSFIS